MTTRPELATDADLARGAGAIVLFVVLAGAFLFADFGSAAWFPADAAETAGIGYALLGLVEQTPLLSKGFLAAFEIIDIALVAAVVAAVTLARKDGGEA
ncbi:NADH dehydrogenase-like complex, subunit J2 [Halarchaeum acidiphilum MH1-52-1]|uniref:NADH dehydrogenase-like complex, subunit J2 n=1 Tax=Halarchaeum acidiphilum MH1-52-1 TaxID=1261545 RepID=U2YSY8_9EURY|nr:hypothetical protein [Halarchaeum acidiphilum]GAD52130.1 NADH dehydrogenase-like complex, subunit J2 [Halarchaeum acidiphilum MH1-52-1]